MKAFVERLNHVYETIAQRFSEFLQDDEETSHRHINDWFKAECARLFPITINMIETKDTVLVGARVPGFAERDITIRAEPTQLMISGTRRPNRSNIDSESIRSTMILRIVDLPALVDQKSVTATLSDGVLEIEMPKMRPRLVACSNGRTHSSRFDPWSV